MEQPRSYMLERFLEIWPSAAKAVIDCELSITKELSAIQDIVSSLQPVKAGAKKLENREMTILGAEGVFGFILGELAAQKTPFAELLRESLLLRIKERRNGGPQCLVGLVINFLWTTSKNGVSVEFTQECGILNTLKVCSYLVLYCHTGAVFALISSVVLTTTPTPAPP